MDDKKLNPPAYEMMPETKVIDPQSPVSILLKGMTAEDWRDQAVEQYTQCYICGKPLNFSHQTDFTALTVEEEAHCMDCQICTKKSGHRLQ